MSRASRPTRLAVPSAGVMRLLAGARRALAEAGATRDPLERFAFAHLSALRAAAALLADRSGPTHSPPRRPTSVWTLLDAVAPEFEPWTRSFAANAGKRVAAEAGVPGAVDAREADALLAAAGTFVELVETALGQLPMAATVRRAS